MAQFSFVASRLDLNTRSKHRLRAILQNYSVKFEAHCDYDTLFLFEAEPLFATALIYRYFATFSINIKKAIARSEVAREIGSS